MIKFFVPGEAKGAGSKRAFTRKVGGKIVGVGVEDDTGKEGKAWRTSVADRAMDQVKNLPDGNLFDCPLTVYLYFYRQRPSGHLRKDGTVKTSSPPRPITKPDVLKLARAVEDAITGILWRDDSLIVREVLEKRFCDEKQQHPGVWIWIEPWKEPASPSQT